MSVWTPQLPFHNLLERIRAAVPGSLQIHLVGGAVRDILLDRPTHDLDFLISGSNVLQISRVIANALAGAYYPLDAERETARVILEGDQGRQILDFAAPRGPDLKSDLLGRDFTINAMAIELSAPFKLVDPLNGARDLREKQLRACSPGSILEDPVRILRAVRLAVDLGMKIQPETKTLIRQAVPELGRVSAERLRDELFRILDGKQIATALRLLDLFSALSLICPELMSLKGLYQPPPHIDDVWGHTLGVTDRLNDVFNVLALQYEPEMAANWALGLISLRLGRYRQQIDSHLNTPLTIARSRRALLLLAALYHDSGKPDARQIDQSGKPRFFDHALIGEKLVGQRAQQLRLSNVEIQYLKTVVRHHMRPLQLAQADTPPSRRAIYRFFRDCGEAGVDVCLLSMADALATYGPTLPQDVWGSHLDTVRALLSAFWEQNQEQVAPPALVSGHDLLDNFGLSPGPLIGELLEALREAQAMGEVRDRQEALHFAEGWLAKKIT